MASDELQVLCQSCGEAIDEDPQQLYPPLEQNGEIRLFGIHKSNDYGATVCGSLTTTNLDEDYANRLQFTAISYEWGPDSATSVIVVNGKRLHVRRNLHDFLLRYRQAIGPAKDRHKGRWHKHVYPSSSYEVKYVWIDQICIDQEFDSERNHQVRLMSKIYSKAEHVIAWLGLEPAVEQYLECANHIASQTTESSRSLNDERLRISADSFVSLSYWKRLWIHQEVLLGKGGLMFMAGQVLVSRIKLTDLHMHHRPRSEIIYDRPWPPILNDLLRYDETSWNWSGNLHLYYVACTFSSNLCQNPRDKIYGLQGLVTAEERIEVSYSLSAREVFLNTVDKILEAGIFDISDTYAGFEGPYRASSRIEFLRQVEAMRRRLEHLAVDMGVSLDPEELDQKFFLSFSRPKPSNRLAKIPKGSNSQRELARAHWELVRNVVSLRQVSAVGMAMRALE
jgi:hypothetical protein